MMDPEMIRLAQEQISRIPPDQFMKMQQQMMSNPDLIRMASEGMKNLRSDDLRMAAQQMKNIRPEEMVEMSSRLASASPEELASMRVQADAQRTYELQGARSLKNQGNQLHGQGNYKEAIEKYSRGKENLLRVTTPEAAALLLACSLNLMSCYLKTGEFDKAVAEGTEVLRNDANNLKALYRRGQAYRELGKLRLAFRDMKKATKVDPDDAHVKEVLRQIEEQLEKDGEEVEEEFTLANGPVIEEITDEEAEALNASTSDTRKGIEDEISLQPLSEAEQQTPVFPDTSGLSQTIDSLKQNPEMMRTMHSMMSNMNPEHIASMSGGQMTPEMVKMASNMVKNMSPEDMQRMLDMMPSRKQDEGSIPTPFPPPSLSRDPSASRSELERTQSSAAESTEGSSSSDSMRGQNYPSISPEMQEQMRQTMKDPAMKQMMASMLQNMSPESMVAMSEQMGYKLSREEAEKAQTALSNLSPDVLEKMMKWADRAQQAAQIAKRGKNFLLGKAGLVLAIAVLIVAVLLHYFGIIGG
ncbi:hypothetical protein GOP47_0019935 [Adiantum capillus-veneris]|uniref:Outer envelope protein 61 n=1 Tax=Adiantum capillus-veneris TaxID=13818 RepID=A0A9D4UC92_ADICA|nr:hypothetical protein GOP47_0019935 [Adiantum capillus-veneris]